MDYKIKVINSDYNIHIPESIDSIMTRYLGPRGFELYNGMFVKDVAEDLIDVIREIMEEDANAKFELSLEELLDCAADEISFIGAKELVSLILDIIEMIVLSNSINGLLEVVNPEVG